MCTQRSILIHITFMNNGKAEGAEGAKGKKEADSEERKGKSGQVKDHFIRVLKDENEHFDLVYSKRLPFLIL